MHEMSLAESALRIIEDSARREGARRVTLVVLEIGRLAAVEPAALDFCFAAVTRDTLAAGARLVLEEVPGRGRCPVCGTESAMEERYSTCPRCDGPLAISAGDGMRVREIEIEEGAS